MLCHWDQLAFWLEYRDEGSVYVHYQKIERQTFPCLRWGPLLVSEADDACQGINP